MLLNNKLSMLIAVLLILIIFGCVGVNTSAKNKEWKKCEGEFKVTCYWIGEDDWGYQTATGVRSEAYETAAVDPDVIPLGSNIKVVFRDGTTRYYEAVDTGGAVEGNVVDVFTEDPRYESWYGAKVYIKQTVKKKKKKHKNKITAQLVINFEDAEYSQNLHGVL